MSIPFPEDEPVVPLWPDAARPFGIARSRAYHRRWRAAHYEWAAWLNYHRWPSLRNQRALDFASNYVRRIEDLRP
jgi:hypothetical protein